MNRTLSFVLTRGGDWVRDEFNENQWVGMCLDYDVCSQGTDINDCIFMVLDAMSLLSSEDKDYLSSRFQAPQDEWDRIFEAQAQWIIFRDVCTLDSIKQTMAELNIWAINVFITEEHATS